MLNVCKCAFSGSNEEDSKQAAEAMVQLSGFYNQYGMAIATNCTRYICLAEAYLFDRIIFPMFFLLIFCKIRLKLHSLPAEESSDVDPNYDPSDFLHMPKSKPKHDDKGGDPSKSSKADHHNSDSQDSFNMAEMLIQERKEAAPDAHAMPSRSLDFASSELPTLTGAHNIDVDDVGIQDDLAISDSDEDEQEQKPHTNDRSKSPADNVNDDDLWF